MQTYSNISPKLRRIIGEAAEAHKASIFAAPDSDIPTERCADGRYISITQLKYAYQYFDRLAEFHQKCMGQLVEIKSEPH